MIDNPLHHDRFPRSKAEEEFFGDNGDDYRLEGPARTSLLQLLQEGCPATLERLLAAPTELAALPELPVAAMVVEGVSELDFYLVAARIDAGKLTCYGIADDPQRPPFYARLRERDEPRPPWRPSSYFVLAHPHLSPAGALFDDLERNRGVPPKASTLSPELLARFEEAEQRRAVELKGLEPRFDVAPLLGVVDAPSVLH